jgi:hypothetical protein
MDRDSIRIADNDGSRREDRALHPFRVSVRKLTEHGAGRVVLSTVVSPHNLFGRIYLFVILPPPAGRADDPLERRRGRENLTADRQPFGPGETVSGDR